MKYVKKVFYFTKNQGDLDWHKNEVTAFDNELAKMKTFIVSHSLSNTG